VGVLAKVTDAEIECAKSQSVTSEFAERERRRRRRRR
jgi:hypothetical protein